MAAETNGANKLGLWLSIGVSFALFISMIGATFYVAFATRANTEAIAVQLIFNQNAANDLKGLQLKINSLEVSLNEVETQFCGQDIVRNLMHATDMRTASLLWKKVFGEALPTDNAYYPNICNRRTKQ